MYVQCFTACAGNPEDCEFLDEDQLETFSLSLSEVVNPWKDDLAVRKHGLFRFSYQNQLKYLVEIPRTKLLEHLRDHIDGVRAMFTCAGEVTEDRFKEIMIPFELFTSYMQHVCRVLAIRLLLPDLSDCILRNSQPGRLETALVSISYFQRFHQHLHF